MTDDTLNAAAQGRLRTIIERIENTEDRKSEVMADQKEIYAEAASSGYDVKILRKVVRARKISKAKREEESSVMDAYMLALGEI